MFPQAIGHNTYDAMLDAFNESKQPGQTFNDWFQQRLDARASDECDGPNKAPVWIDEDDEDDDLMMVTAPVKPPPTNPGGNLFESLPSPEAGEDPKQLVHA